MDVHHVEVVRPNPFTDPAGGPESEIQPGDRTVVAHGDRSTRGGDVGRDIVVIFGGRQNLDRVALTKQCSPEVTHMELHPTGHVPRVGTHDADFQRLVDHRDSARASRRGSRSARHSG